MNGPPPSSRPQQQRVQRRGTRAVRRTFTLRTAPNTRNTRRSAPTTPRSRQRSLRGYRQGAQSRLKRFRQQSVLAVAMTSALLMIWGIQDVEQASGQELAADSTAKSPGSNGGTSDPLPSDPAVALEEATDTLREIALSFYGLLPKLCIVLVILILAAVLVRVFRRLIFRFFGEWEKAAAVSALSTIIIYLSSLVIALSIISGDARALIGSVGLVGLALSWALQTPIESFTGWLINSFRSYYQVGDRIEVGEVFGDVVKIDVLTTTVWEAGGPGKAVLGAQPTGAMITFPNWEVLRSNIVNFSRDFPYVWDEVTVGITNESDLVYSMEVVQQTAMQVLGERMKEPAQHYQQLMKKALKTFDVAEEPQVFVSPAEAWTDLTVRYLVNARERRRWSTALLVALAVEMGKNHHNAKMRGAYPRTEVLVAPGNDTFADFVKQASSAGPKE